MPIFGVFQLVTIGNFSKFKIYSRCEENLRLESIMFIAQFAFTLILITSSMMSLARSVLGH